MSKQTIKLLLCSILSLMGMHQLYSQNIEIIDATREPFTPEALIRNFFIGEGVDIIDISYEGINDATGLFSNGTQDLGLEQGIVLGTGKVARFSNNYMNESSTLTSDEDVKNQELADIIGADIIKDIASYEITFIPSADSIQFNYVFASEEYPEYVCSDFNDVFGFFISGPNPAGGQYDSRNIAIVPGTNLPVSINNVNSGIAGSNSNQSGCAENANLDFGQFYNNNTSEHLIFDGVLDPFIAAAKVTPCQTYTIKFSIGDVNDFLKDSAVFLEGKSFSSNRVVVKALTTSASGTITEGCEEASIIFELPTIFSQDEVINFELLGTAENGVDYENLPDIIVVPAGQTSAQLNIKPLEDELDEEIESIGIVIMNGGCLSDTIWVGIEDNSLEAPDAQGPIFLCDNLPDAVDFTIPFTPPSPVVFRNQNEIRIEPVLEPVFSVINVHDIYPSTLGQTDFIQVCIDELIHPWIDDLSIYLYGPDNQFIELTSKNGGNGGNGTQPDFFINTCFTFNAADLISDPIFQPPYTGQFQPEGNWDDFFGRSSYRANGDWRLMMIDDFQGSTGTLRSWSIHFGSSYDVNYSWSPSTGISCTDCPNPSFNPSGSQTYTLNIEDTNGCDLSYDVEVFADDDPTPSPTVICDNVSMDSVSFSWEDVPQALSYSVSINGGAWEDVGQDLIYTVNNVASGTEVTIEIEAIGACTNSVINTATCMTSMCTLNLSVGSLTEPSCDSPDSGQIILEATGGVEPYTFSLDGIENSDGIFNDLSSGDYMLTIRDAQDCISELVIQLEGKNEIIIDGIIENIECGEDTGSIDLTVTGGTGQLDLVWSDNFTGDENALADGTYTLLVSDETGCTAEKEFTINRVADFTAEFDITQPSCGTNGDGSISVSLDDPSLTVDIFWSTGTTGSSIENLNSGLYDVIITNSDGCQLTQSIELENSTVITVDAQVQNNSCFGDTQGIVDIELSGGDAPYDIIWSNNMQGRQIEDLEAGIYVASISDANGCEMTQSIEITEPQALLIEELVVERPTCVLNTASVSFNPAGGFGPYMARLNGGSFQDQMFFSNLRAGEYHIEIMDDFGCTYESDEVIIIEELEDLELITEPTIQLDLGESTALFATVTNGSGDIEYIWEGSDLNLLSCFTCQSPIFIGLNSTSYTVTAIDEDGCETTQNVVIDINNNAEIYVPNAFSPNGDGINDRFTVFAKSNLISSIDNLSVFDRWGNQVFSRSTMKVNDVSQGWDGKYRGDLLNQGVFVWALQVTFIDGSSKHFSGDVSIIK